jgi:hypothetical protein
MSHDAWVNLSEKERGLLLEAISLMRLYRGSGKRGVRDLNALEKKLSASAIHPGITVGVYGGQVQWVMGNPFPIRICDYDGEKLDLPDSDENGEPCRIWFEPPDQQTKAA